MSILTQHVLPQSFSDGQIISIVTPGVAIAQTEVSQTLADSGQVIQTLYGVSSVQSHQMMSDMEKDKQNIYNHPMFPLMALMFERCEQASASTEFPSPEGIKADIEAFIHHQDKKCLLSGDSDLDNLVIKAIQVLRIHLLELEKVNELCKDFCQRYTNCLKAKLQSENLLRTECDYDQSMFDEPPPEQDNLQSVIVSSAQSVILQQPFQSMQAMPALGPGQIMSGGTVYQMVQTPQGLVAQPIQITPTISIAAQVIHGSTPLSQIGLSQTQTLISSTSNSTAVNNNHSSVMSGFDSDEDDSGKKKSKRGVLPKSATQIMKSWLFQHIVHPYPTEDEKRHIAQQTNLTLLQVNNWFINARRRILQPMLDAGNPEPAKSKKAKPQNKPPQRFWPFSSQAGQPPTTTSVLIDSAVYSPSLTDVSSLSTTIVIPPGAFFTADGQLVSLQGTNMAAMLHHVKQTSPSPPSDNKESGSDTNNNSHNTDNENDDLT